MPSDTQPGRTQHLPCQNCDADLFEKDAEETTAMVDDRPFEFGGKQAEKEVPALVCPECGEVTPL